MKAGTLNHMKMKRLQRRLGLPLFQAAGILEALWQITAESADEGDIGRFSDEDIAMTLEWPGDATALITALVDTGWLDVDQDSRIVVHDWLEHAPDYIKERVRKRGARTRKRQLNCPTTTRTDAGHIRTAAGHTQTDAGPPADCPAAVPPVSESVPSIPYQAHPIHTPPNPSNSSPTQPTEPGQVESGVSRKRFSLGRNAKRAEILTASGAQRVFESAVTAGICTRDERLHIFRLVASLCDEPGNVPGILTSILRDGAGQDPWRARGIDHEQTAREWMRTIDTPEEMQQRTSDLLSAGHQSSLASQVAALKMRFPLPGKR